MASTWRFALFLSVLLLVSRGPSLANEEAGTTEPSSGHEDTSSSSPASGHDTESGHDTTGDAGHGDTGHGDTGDGHGGGPITTLPIVTWRWHHVSTPYLVALWILVSWLCKISEFHQVRSTES